MAVTQISRIQHRRGLEQDLPQLSSAELGWSIDTRKLYIGNGTLDEGAPTTGITRILTEYDIAGLQSAASNSYTFGGNSAGYTVQTGASSLSPVIRTLQAKLDDVVNVRDFGVAGNGSTDDTAAINRALQQIYLPGTSDIDPRARRTVYFPGGTYLVSTPILIPPFARLVGEGMGSSIIKQVNAGQAAANICDSKFQTGPSIGSDSALLPHDIEITGLQFTNTSINTQFPVLVVDSASNVRIQNTKFTSGATSTYPTLVSIYSNFEGSKKVTFDGCQFINGGTGLHAVGSSITGVRVINSAFDNIANTAVNLGTLQGYTSIGNYYGVSGGIIGNGNNYNVSIGDYSYFDQAAYLLLGNIQYDSSKQIVLTTSTTAILTVPNTAGVIDYEIKQGSNVRFGTFTFSTSNSNILYDDNYVEPVQSLNANISANNDSILASMSSGIATFKYAIKQFI